MRIFLILTILLLFACANLRYLDEGLSTLAGKDIDSATKILGYPDDTQQFKDKTIYVWSSSTAKTHFGTNGSDTTTATYSCTIKIAVDQGDKIIDWGYDGQVGGCESYANLFRRHLAFTKAD